MCKLAIIYLPIFPYDNFYEVINDWFDKFNYEFFDVKLGTPMIFFTNDNCDSLDIINTYGIKWVHNVSVHEQHPPLWLILMTLLHEMVYEYVKKCIDLRKSKKYDCQNIEFQRKMESLGIPCDSQKGTIEIKNPFVSFLKKHGVEVEPVKFLKNKGFERVEKGSKLKLKNWTCGCTDVRVAIEDFQARCLKCGKKFTLI